MRCSDITGLGHSLKSGTETRDPTPWDPCTLGPGTLRPGTRAPYPGTL